MIHLRTCLLFGSTCICVWCVVALATSGSEELGIPCVKGHNPHVVCCEWVEGFSCLEAIGCRLPLLVELEMVPTSSKNKSSQHWVVGHYALRQLMADGKDCLGITGTSKAEITNLTNNVLASPDVSVYFAARFPGTSSEPFWYHLGIILAFLMNLPITFLVSPEQIWPPIVAEVME